MATFSDFEYYSEEYKGLLTEEEYKKYVVQAYITIMSNTDGLSRAPEGSDCYNSMLENLKRAECELTDLIEANADIAIGEVGIASVNNDGYSISTGSSSTSANETVDGAIMNILDTWLVYPCNLICRWL